MAVTELWEVQCVYLLKTNRYPTRPKDIHLLNLENKTNQKKKESGDPSAGIRPPE